MKRGRHSARAAWLVTVAVTTCAALRHAYAEPLAAKASVDEHPSSAFAARKLAIEGHLGLGTPVGELGAMTEYAPWPFLGLGTGLGYGSGPSGSEVHYAAGARVRPFGGLNDAFFVGSTYSVGGYRRLNLNYSDGVDDERRQLMRWAHWMQFDLGWEHRATSGFLLRATVGIAALLNPADMTCAAICMEPPPTHEDIPTIDIAIGYAL